LSLFSITRFRILVNVGGSWGFFADVACQFIVGERAGFVLICADGLVLICADGTWVLYCLAVALAFQAVSMLVHGSLFSSRIWAFAIELSVDPSLIPVFTDVSFKSLFGVLSLDSFW
jgi:hypothetical protein